MARQKRIFREWQHPRDGRGRFARHGSPEWVKAAAEKFRAADTALTAGTRGPGLPNRAPGGRAQIGRGAKAGALFAAHDAGRDTRLSPVQHGPARPPKAKTSALTPSQVSDLREEYMDLKGRIGQREGVGGMSSKLRDQAEELERIAADNGVSLTPPRMFGRKQPKVDTPRDGGQAGGMSTTERQDTSRVERIAAIEAGHGTVASGPVSMTPKTSAADIENRYGGAAAAIARRKAEKAAAADKLGLADEPKQIDVIRDVAAKVKQAKAEGTTGATAYDNMDRGTLLALARQAKVPVRGKSNDQIAAGLHAKDEQRKAAKAAKLNPDGIGTPSSQHEQHTTPPGSDLHARYVAHYNARTDGELQRAAEIEGVSPVGKDRDALIRALAAKRLEEDRRIEGRNAVYNNVLSSGGTITTSSVTGLGGGERTGITGAWKGGGARPKADAVPTGNGGMSDAEISDFMRSKGFDPTEFSAEERRDWLQRHEAAFGAVRKPQAGNDASKLAERLKAQLRGLELERESADLYGDSTGGDEDERDRAKKAQRKELDDLRAQLLEAERAERGFGKTPSKAFAKLSDAALEREIKAARPGTKKLQDLRDERDARAAARFKGARPKADAAQVAAAETPKAPTTSTPVAGAAALEAAPLRIHLGKLRNTPEGMTPQQAQRAARALEHYRDIGYLDLNRDLRIGKTNNKTVAANLADLRTAFAASPLQRDVTVYRGTSDLKMLGSSSAGSAVGKTWTDAAPGSTTIDERVARGFGDGGAMLRITVPAGTGAVQLSDAPGRGKLDDREGELLLQDGLTYRVTGDRMERGVRVLDVQVERVDTPRDKPQTGGVSNAPTTEANVTVKPKSKLTPIQDASLRHLVEHDRKQNGRDEYAAQRASEEKYGAPVRTSGDAMAKLEAKGLVTFTSAGFEPTEAGRRHVVGTAPAGPYVEKKVQLTGTVASVGSRPRTGTWTGEIKADRKERLGDKAFTDHVKMLTLVAETSDQVKAWGFGPSDRPLQVGDEVVTHTFNRFRRGIVTGVTRDGKGSARIAYATPSGGYAQETTAPHAEVWQLTDPAKRPGENRAALLPQIAPEVRPRVSAEDREAVKEAKKAAEKARVAASTQRFFDEKIQGIEASLKGESPNPPEWHLQLTTEAGVVSLAKHLGVKVANRRQDPVYGGPMPRNREEVDKIRQDIIAAIRARQAASAPKAPAGGDSITRHTTAPVSVDIFENGAGQLDIGPANSRTVYDISRQGGVWQAEHLQGPTVGGSSHQAATLPDLARKVANAHGVSGTVSIEDEREKGRSLTQRFEHAAKAAPARVATPAAGPARLRDLPVGTTDAQAAKAMPRLDGESDLAYQVRTVTEEGTARRVLDGYSAAGLRAIARDNNVTVRSGATKPQLVEALLDALRRRWRDSRAFDKR